MDEADGWQRTSQRNEARRGDTLCSGRPSLEQREEPREAGSGNVSCGENLSPPCLHLLHKGVVLTISKDSPASILQSLDPRAPGRA